jgi:ribosomal protein S18 acetylase RimI-like enzyme
MAHRPPGGGEPPPGALVRYRDIYPQDVLRVDDLQRQLFPVRLRTNAAHREIKHGGHAARQRGHHRGGAGQAALQKLGQGIRTLTHMGTHCATAHCLQVRYSEAFYQRLFTPGHFTVLAVIASGEVVGIASARTVADEAVGSREERREGYIMTLGVRADFRKLGIGGELLRRIMGVLRTHCTVAALHVKSLNADALRFYERNGFRADPAGDWYPGHYLIEGVQFDAYKLICPLSSGWIHWLSQRLGRR